MKPTTKRAAVKHPKKTAALPTKREKVSALTARQDNRLATGNLFRPMSKQELAAEERPKRSIIAKGHYGGHAYAANIGAYEELSMSDELVLLACLALIAPYHRGRKLNPVQLPEDHAPGNLWEMLRVSAHTSTGSSEAGLVDPRDAPTLQLETTPSELLRALGWSRGGDQIKRLLKSLHRLSRTHFTFRVETPEWNYTASSNLLSFVYTERTRGSCVRRLTVAINHFSASSVDSKAGGYVMHELDEKRGLSELQLAIHSELNRSVTPGTIQAVKIRNILSRVFPNGHDRKHAFRFREAVAVLSRHLKQYGWAIRVREDGDTMDVSRPAPPKAEDHLTLISPAETPG